MNFGMTRDLIIFTFLGHGSTLILTRLSTLVRFVPQSFLFGLHNERLLSLDATKALVHAFVAFYYMSTCRAYKQTAVCYKCCFEAAYRRHCHVTPYCTSWTG